MTSYTWYWIFNADDFADLGIISKTYTLILEGIGQTDVLVTQGNFLGITYEGIYLPLNMSEKNPFEFDSHAIFLDENNDVWLGLPVEE